MKNFDWDAFENDIIAVHCSTRELTDDFLSTCKERGITWSNGEIATEYDPYTEGDGSTCELDDTLTHASFNYFNDNEYKIIEWIADNEKTFTQVIATIRDGEVWELVNSTVTLSNNLLTIGDSTGAVTFDLNEKLKLKRQEVSFPEAYTMMKSGKIIECLCEGNKFTIKQGEIFLVDDNGNYELSPNGFTINEIESKWAV